MGSPPLLLAIDTSTAVASVALYAGQVLAETTWRAEQHHTRQLLPVIQRLLDLAQRPVAALEGVVVALGPGGFSGLRVGVTTAKVLAAVLDCPIVGCGTLEVIAYAHRETALPIRPILPGGRGEVATALYQREGERVALLEPPRLVELGALIAETTQPTLFCGEIAPEQAQMLQAALGERAVIVGPAQRVRRAAFLAELGWQRLQQGIMDDVITLQPLYLRRPAITLPRRPLTLTGER
jgi:tRNA threonylcarbamoyladenosine biosynthesis protein TsaB